MSLFFKLLCHVIFIINPYSYSCHTLTALLATPFSLLWKCPLTGLHMSETFAFIKTFACFIPMTQCCFLGGFIPLILQSYHSVILQEASLFTLSERASIPLFLYTVRCYLPMILFMNQLLLHCHCVHLLVSCLSLKYMLLPPPWFFGHLGVPTLAFYNQPRHIAVNQYMS